MGQIFGLWGRTVRTAWTERRRWPTVGSRVRKTVLIRPQEEATCPMLVGAAGGRKLGSLCLVSQYTE